MSVPPVVDARQAILDSAVPVFARKGYAGASVQDILEATGLSKPTLYYHFESKAGLFRAILDRAHDRCLALMQDEVAQATDIEERLSRVALALFQFTQRNQHLIRLVLSSAFAASEEIPPGCIDMTKRRRNFEFIVGLIRHAQAAGELAAGYSSEELAHGIFGAISHHIRSHLLLSAGDLGEDRARSIVTLFLDGARKRRRTRARRRPAADAPKTLHS